MGQMSEPAEAAGLAGPAGAIRILLSLAALALVILVVLSLIGLWNRYTLEAKQLGFSGIYERYLAFQSGFPGDPAAYRAAVEAERLDPGYR
jgi:hypothetical protein